MNNKYELKYEDTTFIKMIRKIGISRFIISEDFIFALILSLIFTILCLYGMVLKEVIIELSIVFITISGTMIAIAIAGLAIIVSMSDPEFINSLKDASPLHKPNQSVYDNILFFFRYSTVISSMSILMNIVGRIYIIFSENDTGLILCVFFSSFFMLYAVFIVIMLVGTTMRYGRYRGIFCKLKEDNQKEK